MIVRLFGASGLTKAYRSVLSAAGSPAMSGASRWLEARTPVTDVAAMRRAPATPATFDRVDKTVSPSECGGSRASPRGRPGRGQLDGWRPPFGAVVGAAQGLCGWVNRGCGAGRWGG